MSDSFVSRNGRCTWLIKDSYPLLSKQDSIVTCLFRSYCPFNKTQSSTNSNSKGLLIVASSVGGQATPNVWTSDDIRLFSFMIQFPKMLKSPSGVTPLHSQPKRTAPACLDLASPRSGRLNKYQWRKDKLLQSPVPHSLASNLPPETAERPRAREFVCSASSRESCQYPQVL